MHLHVLAVNWKQSRLHGLFSDIMARIHGLFHPQKRHNIWGLEAQNICPWPGETCRISLKIIQELKDTGSVLSWHPLFILNPTLTNKTSFWHHVFWGMHYFFFEIPTFIFQWTESCWKSYLWKFCIHWHGQSLKTTDKKTHEKKWVMTQPISNPNILGMNICLLRLGSSIS